MKKTTLLILALVICLSLSACGKSEAIIAAEDAVKAIGTVTLDSKTAISDAEEAINSLSSEDKKRFRMNDEFEEIKRQYEQLVGEKTVSDIVGQIDALGEITLESGTKIEEIEKAYAELSSELQQKVSNKSKLENARATLDALRMAEKERIIAEKTSAFNLNHDKVENITWYEHKNLPNYIDIRSYIIPFIGKSGNNYWISTRYNYTADSWIFWENMTIMVDGVKYYKYVGSGNTVRDNDTEVWEYYEESLDYNVGMDNKELKMLKAISESSETIIRFQGDEYYYDLYVSPTDKKIISDVLALYQALTW